MFAQEFEKTAKMAVGRPASVLQMIRKGMPACPKKVALKKKVGK